jgi:hypothetical protein
MEVDLMSGVILSEKMHDHYGKCIELSNGTVDLLTTVELGSRIIRYGFIGCQNEFCDNAPLTLNVGNDKWQLIGGHRLWHSPEAFPRTYTPDNDPVDWEKIENGIKVTSKIQQWTQIKKVMEITLSPIGRKVRILHKLINGNAWSVELSAWSLTVMAPGGKEIIPQPQHKGHFSDGFKGARVIALWSYAKMNDPRVYWGDKYITLQQNRNIETTIKFGISNEDGWGAYINNNHLFIKKYIHNGNAKYPDGGVSYETFTCDFMLEMESLSPLTLLEPDKEVTHIEEWDLVDVIDMPANDEEQIDKIVDKYIKIF